MPSTKQIVSLRDSDAKINVWEGAVRSGKTYISLWRFLEELASGSEGIYAVICRTYDSFTRNILPLLENIIGFDARHYSGKRQMIIWNKVIHIIGANDAAAELKIRGTTLAGAYVDEATIIPESVWMQLISRCTMGSAKIFATTNPDSPYHWLKQNFLEGNPDVKSWQFRLDDNPQLSSEEKEYLKRQYKGIWYKRFIEGLWVQAEGAVYDFFDEKIHVIDLPPYRAASYIVGVDYGTTNPTAFVLIGFNFNYYPNIWVEDEYYFDSRKEQRQKTDSEYALDLIGFIKEKRIEGIYIDPSAASFRVELMKRGVDPVFEAENEVKDGICFVSTLLGDGTVKICKRCKNIIQEFNSYVWDPKSLRTGEDRPLKQNDHALDALRYALYTRFFNKESSSLSAKDLDRLDREAKGAAQDLPLFFQDPSPSSYSHYPRY